MDRPAANNPLPGLTGLHCVLLALFPGSSLPTIYKGAWE